MCKSGMHLVLYIRVADDLACLIANSDREEPTADFLATIFDAMR